MTVEGLKLFINAQVCTWYLHRERGRWEGKNRGVREMGRNGGGGKRGEGVRLLRD